jgi:hypothetical protein
MTTTELAKQLTAGTKRCARVNGHVDLPSGGREISPWAVTRCSPLAAMRFPQSRGSGWV